MMRFGGKVTLITGGGSGIGLAAAKAFAAEGARVIVADRDIDGAEAAAETIARAGGVAVAVRADVSDFASCQAMVAHAVETFGGLDIAFNNAGVPTAIGGEFEDFAIDEWRRVLATNLDGVFLAMKAEVPALKARGGGAIINTASVASLVAAPGMPGYVASKHAVAGLTKAAALDLIRHNIRVNAIAPGFIETAMTAGALGDPQARAGIEGMIPAGRAGAAEEAAAAALFLASDAASYCIGAILTIDGGVTLQ